MRPRLRFPGSLLVENGTPTVSFSVVGVVLSDTKKGESTSVRVEERPVTFGDLRPLHHPTPLGSSFRSWRTIPLFDPIFFTLNHAT